MKRLCVLAALFFIMSCTCMAELSVPFFEGYAPDVIVVEKEMDSIELERENGIVALSMLDIKTYSGDVCVEKTSDMINEDSGRRELTVRITYNIDDFAGIFGMSAKRYDFTCFVGLHDYYTGKALAVIPIMNEWIENDVEHGDKIYEIDVLLGEGTLEADGSNVVISFDFTFSMPPEYDGLVLSVCPGYEYEDRVDFITWKKEHAAHEYLTRELAAEERFQKTVFLRIL